VVVDHCCDAPAVVLLLLLVLRYVPCLAVPWCSCLDAKVPDCQDTAEYQPCLCLETALALSHGASALHVEGTALLGDGARQCQIQAQGLCPRRQPAPGKVLLCVLSAGAA
jgi:hypothetical protein